MSDVFLTRRPTVAGNPGVRAPQQETYAALEEFAQADDREAGVVLPVGCGKSGCIALAPFAFRAQRALVIAPGLRIAQQLAADFDPSSVDMFTLRLGR
jgi:superfamily II DNA or RNA helicase